jgi:hypothetical protein
MEEQLCQIILSMVMIFLSSIFDVFCLSVHYLLNDRYLICVKLNCVNILSDDVNISKLLSIIHFQNLPLSKI